MTRIRLVLCMLLLSLEILCNLSKYVVKIDTNKYLMDNICSS